MSYVLNIQDIVDSSMVAELRATYYVAQCCTYKFICEAYSSRPPILSFAPNA